MVAAFSRGYQLVEEPCDRVDFFDKRGYRNIRDLHSLSNHLLEIKIKLDHKLLGYFNAFYEHKTIMSNLVTDDL